MAKNPLGKIKDLTKGAASVGLHVAGQATKTATTFTAGAVSKLVQGRKLDIAPAPVAPEAKAPAPEPKAPAKKPEPSSEPLTTIDAAADTAHVDVTPADVAKKVARKPPARPAAKKAPARKTSPGAKLPPRKKLDETTSGADKG